MRPPRALYPKDFQIGNSLGKPGMHDLQKKVLKDALLQFTAVPAPGEIIEKVYPEYPAPPAA